MSDGGYMLAMSGPWRVESIAKRIDAFFAPPGSRVPSITVNVRPSPSIPFIVVGSSERVVSSSVLLKIADAVESMPARINLPKKYDKVILPKAYMVAYEHSGAGVTIQDIVGVRMSGLTAQPSPWCYSRGYWHPMINVLIANALRKAAETGSVAPDLEFEGG